MKLRLITFAFIAIGFATVQISCKKDKVPPAFITAECPDTVFFQTKIKTIMTANCSTSGCHNASSAAGTIVLETHAQISAKATNILNAIRHTSGSPMPQGGAKLPDSIGNQIECWINQGTLNN